MIVYKIPKSAKIIKTFTVFSAIFNADPLNLGKYSFTFNTGNQFKNILDTKQNTVYLIDRASFSGNISSNSFNKSLLFNQPLQLTFYRKISQEILYQNPIPINGYFQEVDFSAFFTSDKQDDSLQVSLSGILNQDSENIGVLAIYLFLNLTIYAMDEREYNSMYRSKDVYAGI